MSTANRADRPTHVILVAEDDTLIRAFAIDALIEAGFAVIEARHAGAALNILTGRADQVRALFTDIHMPGAMSGLDLAHHVRRHWPWIALLVTSGKAQPAPEEMPPGCRFLPKPYESGLMVKHIRELTDAR